MTSDSTSRTDARPSSHFSADLFSFAPGTKYRLSLPAAASDAAAIGEAGLEARRRGERILVVCADPADVRRLTQECAWFAPEADVRALPDW